MKALLRRKLLLLVIWLHKRLDATYERRIYLYGFSKGVEKGTADTRSRMLQEESNRKAQAKAKLEKKIAFVRKERNRLPKGLKRQVLREGGYTCHYCGEMNATTVDHLIPLIKGGKNERSNLVPSCEECNRDKGSLTHTEFL